jgi:ATP-dependent DNA ligase
VPEKILKAVEFSKTGAKLRKQYADEDALWHAGWLMQPKYDGCFGMAMIRSKDGESQMLSRTGEDYTTSCLHILEEIREAADDQSGSWDDFVVLGEVWQPDTKFPTISGRFRKRAASNLEFKANDLLPPELVSTRKYAARLTDLQLLLPDIPDVICYATTVDSIQYDPELTAVGEARRLVALGGYDGAILRDPRAPYTLGIALAGQIVKVKPTLSLDLRCNGVIQGEGKHAGKLGAITVGYRGVSTAVGTGFSDEDRDFM